MQLIWYFVLGAIMGTLSGLLGIGGGVVVVPGLVFLLGMDLKKAMAMSLAVIIPVAISGLCKHFSAGTIHFRELKSAILVAIGGIIFAVVGAHLNKIIPADALRKVFAIFLIFIGVKMLLQKPKKPEPKTDSQTVEAAETAIGTATLNAAPENPEIDSTIAH